MRRTTRTAALLTSSAVLVLLGACSSDSAEDTAQSPTAAATTTAPAEETATDTATQAAGTSGTYTLDDVAAHASQSDCWAAIGGNVYDLTQWISAHPGGADKIIPLCGTDGTAAFTGQHDSQEDPNERLRGFQIGVLG